MPPLAPLHYSADGERADTRGSPSPLPRNQRPSYLPLPTQLTASYSSALGLAAQADRASSSASHASHDDMRTGRSSSLSTSTRTATPTPTSLPRQTSRPPFSLGDTGSPYAHYRTGSAGAGAGSMVKDRSNSYSSIQLVGGSPARSGAPADMADSRYSMATVDDGDDCERVLPVKVAVRIRPLLVGGSGPVENNSSEWAAAPLSRAQAASCLEALPNATIVVSSAAAGSADELAGLGASRHSVIGSANGNTGPGGSAAGPRSFTYDHAFGPEASQPAVYEAAVAPLLARFVEGYNVTVLAYGQTSSGKTYTMGTDAGDILASTAGDSLAPSADDSHAVGIVPRALHWLFAWAQTGPSALRPGIDIRVSFLEVYNEELIDLVARTQSRGVGPPIFIREDAKGNILWTGVREVTVTCADDALALLVDGSRERQTGGTRMNEKSSRSHAIYSISLAQTRLRKRSDADRATEPVKIVSKLHFVDLAGSERLKKTLAVGERQREGIAINSGLLALGNVISALGDANRGPLAHVPYRDSKLTYMLRDSLGGNAQTLLIACVSAAEVNATESINTLKYAARARNIKNRGGVNMVSVGRVSTKEVESLRAMVRKLKGEVRLLKEQLQDGAPGLPGLPPPTGSARGLLASPARSSNGFAAAGEETPSKIPTMGMALQRRAQAAEELNTLKTRNQTLEAELEQLNDTYTDLLLKFNDACREMEERQSEGFERDQRLRDREQELRRLTSHSTRSRLPSIAGSAMSSRPPSVADALRRKRRSTGLSMALGLVGEGDDAGGLPASAAFGGVRSDDASDDSDGPRAAEFDAILEEHDSSIRALEDNLRAAREELDGKNVQLSMQEAKASFAEKLNAAQLAQIETLRMQVSKARAAAEDEEQRRRALEAELEEANFNAETHMEVVINDSRLELLHVDEQWTERWTAAQQEHKDELQALQDASQAWPERWEAAQQEYAAKLAAQQQEIAGLRAELKSVPERECEQLMSPPPTAHDIQQRRQQDERLQDERLQDEQLQKQAPSRAASMPRDDAEASRLNARIEQLELELRQSTKTARHLELELHNSGETFAKLQAELQSSRVQALEAEARAGRMEEALAARAADSKGAAARTAVTRSYSELPSRTSDRIVLCARNSIARKGEAGAAPPTDSPTLAEQRLRAMGRYRHSTVPGGAGVAAPEQPARDKCASYPELRPASASAAGGGPSGRQLPVYDEDQIRSMLRDAVAEADQETCHERERRAMTAEIGRLKEKTNDLQGRNSQLKNLMRDLGDRLVGLAEENDMLEAKANDRDELAVEVARLEEVVDDLKRRLQAAEDAAAAAAQADEACADPRALEPPAPAEPAADPEELARLREKLDAVSDDLAAAAARASQAEADMVRHSNELIRARAETEALARRLDDARAMVSREARDRDIWKGRSQDLRDELDEIRMSSRRRSKLFCFH